jgi:hypothetical protein
MKPTKTVIYKWAIPTDDPEIGDIHVEIFERPSLEWEWRARDDGGAHGQGIETEFDDAKRSAAVWAGYPASVLT